MSTRQLIITDYQTHHREIRHIRDRVFLVEQNIRRDDECDDRDPVCLHALVFQHGKPVGTGRLDVEKGGKIGRVAVLREHRGQGIGRQIMDGLVEAAQARKLAQIWFHAQLPAVPFYQQLGYEIRGQQFEEAGIPHLFMRRELR